MILSNWLVALREGQRRHRESRLPKLAEVRQNISHLSTWVESLEDRCVLSAAAGYSLADVSWFGTVSASGTDSTSTTTVSAASVGTSSGVNVEREFLIRLTPEAVDQVHSLQQSQVLFVDSGAGLHVVRGLGLPGQLVVATSEPDSEQIIAALRQNSHVAHFEEDLSVGASEVTPNDPRFNEQYGLNNFNFPGGTNDADIDAPEAWSITTGSSQVIVSLVDTGVDFTHPDLYLNIWLNNAEIPASLRASLVDVDGDGTISFRDLNGSDGKVGGPNASRVQDRNHTGYIDAGDLLDNPQWADGLDTDGDGKEDDLVGWDFQDDDNRPFDEHGHGTHVAGILGASGNNGVGVSGVNWTTTILPLRFLDENNTGELSDAIEAINYQTMLRTREAHPENIRVSNNSWGVTGSLSQNLFDAVAATGAADILLVSAAGNGDLLGRGTDNDQTPVYPANLDLPNVLSVAAFGPNGTLARFSNFGDRTVDITAPGVGIVSTSPGGAYASRNGTSMATPFVSGTAALVLARHPAASAVEVRDAILSGAYTATTLADQIAGGRRLNAYGAVTASTFAPVPSLESVSSITAGTTEVAITVAYDDDTGVDVTAFDIRDLEITRRGFSEFLLQPDSASTTTINGKPAAIYRFAAPGGTWDATEFGTYDIHLREGEIRDTDGLYSSPRRIGSFNVTLTEPNVFFVDTTLDLVDSNPFDGIARGNFGVKSFVSLRAAIMQANANAVPTTIVVPDGVYTLTIAGRNEDAAATGDLDLRSSFMTTILGGGASTTIIDAQQLDRVFDVGTNANAVIRGVAIVNGNASSGGGIQNSQATLLLDSVLVSRNTAELSGGGISNAGGLLTVRGSSVEGNRTTSRFFGQGGGGIASDRAATTAATIVIETSSIVNNVSSLAGGGIATLDSDLTLTGSTISGNIAQRQNGGGLFVNGDRLVEGETVLTISSSTIVNNRAELGNGGGVASSRPTLRFDTSNSIIAQNSARFSEDIDGVILSHGNNVLGQPGVTFTPWRQLVLGVADFDQIGTVQSALNPGLEPLQQIAGIVQAHAPLSGGVSTNSATAGLAGLALTRGMPIVYSTVELEPNNTPAEAMNLDDRGWSLDANPDISDATTVPHVTITGTGDGTFDYFAFNVSTAGTNAVFDMDNAGIMPDRFFDSELFLFGLDGTLLASNDDSATDAGSNSNFDSRIAYQFATPGRYVIAVGARNSTADSQGIVTGAVPTLGKEYVLQVSLEHHPLAATIYDATTASALHPLDGAATENGYLFSAEEGLNIFDLPRSYGTGNVPFSIAFGDLTGDGQLDLVTANSGATTVSVLIGRGDGTFDDAVNYKVGNDPYSVTMGDVDGDGRLDLVTANSGATTVSVLIGRGDGTFEAAVNYFVGSRPTSVAIGDVNGDDRLDLVTANYSSNTVSVLIGRGDGTFKAAVNYFVGSGPFSVAMGDVNGDDRLDLVTADIGSGTVSVLMQRSDGTFEAAVNYGVGSDPISVAMGDVNGDDRLDLVTANYSSNTVSVLIGRGDGTFDEAVNYDIGSGPNSVAMGDVNGDDRLDLVTANIDSGTVSVLIGRDDGKFEEEAVNYFVGSGGYSVAMRDVTGDDRLDLVTTNSNNFSNTVSVLIGRGDGTFGAAVNYAAGSRPSSVAIGDVSGDGRLDLVTANSKSGNVSVRVGRGDGTFNALVNYTVGSGPSSVAMGDVNGDDWLDLVTANSDDTTVSVLIGRGDGTFDEAVNDQVGNAPYSVTMGDVNGDDRLDLVTANGSSTVSVLIGRGDGTFEAAVNYAVDSGSTSVAMGDVNGDGRLDLITANAASTMSVLIGQGDGTFLAAVNHPSDFDPESVAVADLNSDGRLDVVLSNFASDSVSVLIGQGDGTFAAAVNYQLGGGSQYVVVGDVTGDGRLDLVTANYSSGTVSVLIGRGDGTFLEAVSYAVGPLPQSLALGDLNGDGRLDLVTATETGVTIGIHSRARLFLLSPQGDQLISLPSRGTPELLTTGTASTYWVTATSGSNAVELWSYQDSAGIRQLASFVVSSTRDFPIKLLVGDDAVQAVSVERVHTVELATQSTADVPLADGTFEAEANYQVGNFPVSVSMGDVTGDGRLDLVTANFSSDTVSVLAGRGDATFEAAVNYFVGSAPVSVAIGYVNGDDRLDLVTANVSGTVSVLIGRKDGTFEAVVNYVVGSRPSSVAMGNVDGDGRLDLVTANAGSDDVSVLIGRGDGTFQTPVTYDVGERPLSVALEYLNDDDRLDLVTVNLIGTVSVLIGLGDGTFEAAVNYSVGTHPTSVAIGDVNGDDRLDLVTADSLSDTVSVLIGWGDGTFQTAVNYGVGIDPLSVAVGDVTGDGRLDLVTANAGSDEVSVLVGRGDGTFLTALNYRVGIDPQSVAVGDVTGDGVLDLVTANLASNNVSVLVGRSRVVAMAQLHGTTFVANTAVIQERGLDGTSFTPFRVANTVSRSLTLRQSDYAYFDLGVFEDQLLAAVRLNGDTPRPGELELLLIDSQTGAAESLLTNSSLRLTGSEDDVLQVVGDTIYLTAHLIGGGVGTQLFAFDRADGLRLVADLPPGPESSQVRDLFVDAAGDVYFTALVPRLDNTLRTDVLRRELFVLDAQTGELRAIRAGQEVTGTPELVGSTVYFSSRVSTNASDLLWAFDTTGDDGIPSIGAVTPVTGSVIGTAFLDANENGRRDEDEPGRVGVVIYDDVNRNGRREASEPFAISRADDPATTSDESGSYVFASLVAGSHLLRELPADGYVATSPRSFLLSAAKLSPLAIVTVVGAGPRLGLPSVIGDNVVYIDRNTNTLLLKEGDQLTRVLVSPLTSIPNTSATVQSLGSVQAQDGSNIVFTATLTNGREVVLLLGDDGNLKVIASTAVALATVNPNGTSANVSLVDVEGERVHAFDSLSVDGGSVGFFAKPSAVADGRYYLGDGSQFSVFDHAQVVLDGDTELFVDRVLDGNPPTILTGNDVFLDEAALQVEYPGRNSGWTISTRNGDVIMPLTFFSRIVDVAASGLNVAFRASSASAPDGVYVSSPTEGTRLLVDSSTDTGIPGLVTFIPLYLSATDTTVVVGHPNRFPQSGPFNIKIGDEILRVTAVNGSAFSVTRGVEGTTAAAHVAGDIVAVTFKAFGAVANNLESSSVAIDGHNVVFIGQDINGGIGVYANIEGQLRTIADRNSNFGGSVPVDFHIGHQALSGNRIVLQVNFADGSEAVYLATLPAEPAISVNVQAGRTVEDVSFGASAVRGTIRGVSFADADGDRTFDLGETVNPGRIVFIDQNFSGSLDQGELRAVTDADGAFVFSRLPALNTYVLREVLPDGLVQTTPRNLAEASILLQAAQTVEVLLGSVSQESLGLSSDGRVSGVVFADSNGNGVRDAGELGIAGATVFIDENADRVLNGGERSSVTASDGSYLLDQLPRNRQAVRVVAPTGKAQTNALGNSFSTSTVTLNDSPVDVASGDFDGDGDDDLVTSIDASNTVRFFKNNAGTFAFWRDVSVGFGPGSLEVGKFLGGSGLAGVVVGHESSNSVWVLQPQANGTISSTALSIPGGLGNAPYAVATGNFNPGQDGYDDIAVVSNVSGAVAIFLSNGSGGFTKEQILQLPSTALSPTALVAANLLGHTDGRLDLAVTSVLGNSVTVLVNSGVAGSGRFSLGANLPVGGLYPLSVRAGNLDGDDLPELVTTNFGSNNISVFHNLGNGAFELLPRLGTGGIGPGSLQIVDLDRDGKRDILFANSEAANHFGVLRNRGDGSFQAAELFGVASVVPQTLAFSLAVGQFNDDNGDGQVNASDTVDVVVSNRRQQGIAAKAGFLSIGLNTIVPGALTVDLAAGNATGLNFALQQLTNSPPTLAHAIPNQSAAEDSPFSFTVATNTFADSDVGDTLTLSATRADGTTLPAWLHFDPDTRTFSGTPRAADLATLNIRVTATDSGSPTPASVSATFSLAATGLLELIYTATLTSLVAGIGPDGSVMMFTTARLEVRAGGVVIATPATLDRSRIKSLTINGGTGADTINLTGLTQANYPRLTSIVLNGNAGKDTITGSDLDETISGGSGSTTTDNDSLNGGGGTDRLVEINIAAVKVTVTNTQLTGLGTDVLANFEELSLSGGTAANTFDAANFSGKVTLLGNAGNDVLIGSNRDDSLDGGLGNDKITGNLGDDALSGGAGLDTLIGSGGTNYVLSDTAMSGVGTDSVSGFEAVSLAAPTVGDASVTIDISLFTGLGTNTLTGGNGSDRIIGGLGKDSIKGGIGNDSLTGGLGKDTIDGGAGVDVLIESGNADFTLINTTLTRGTEIDSLLSSSVERAQLTGGAGDNKLIAAKFTLGAVTLDGGGGNDVLIGGSQNDLLLGGEGRDMLVGGLGIDNLNGNAGDDILIGGTISSTISTTAALNLIMAEWTSSARAYVERITKLKTGGGANGTTKLNTTVVLNDSGAADQLNGNEDLDWFFLSVGDVLDAINGETTN